MISIGSGLGRSPENQEPLQVEKSQAETEVEAEVAVNEDPEVAELEEIQIVTEAEETETAADSIEVIEPVLIWQKEFDEEIVGVIFGEAEMTVEEARAIGFKGWEQRRATDIVKVQYPKSVVTKKATKFLDEQGNVIKEGPLWEEGFAPWNKREKIEGTDDYKISSRSICRSKNRDYIGVLDVIAKEGKYNAHDISSQFNYYTSDKKKLCTIKLPDGLRPQCSISDDGSHIFFRIQMEMEWIFALYVYSKEGKLLFSKNKVELLKFSSNGRYAIVSLAKYFPRVRYLQCIDVDEGRILSEIDFGPADRVDVKGVSDNGSFIVRYRERCEVKSYNKEGKLVWSYNNNDYSQASPGFSKNAKYAYVNAGRWNIDKSRSTKVILFNNTTGRIIWETKDNFIELPDRKKMHTPGCCGFSPDEKYFCLGSGGITSLHDIKGGLIWHNQLELKGVRRKREFSKDGRFLMVTDLWSKIVLFQLK
jgi:hypothetical protein